MCIIHLGLQKTKLAGPLISLVLKAQLTSSSDSSFWGARENSGGGGGIQRGKGKIPGGEGADFWGEGEYFGEGRGKISGERGNCGGDVDQQPGRPATQSGTCRGRW